MKKLFLLISILSFIALPLAKETCCSDTQEETTYHCDDHEQGDSHTSSPSHRNHCLKTCCLFVAKIQKSNSFDIISDLIIFEKNYYLHLSKVKNIQVKLLRPPIYS